MAALEVIAKNPDFILEQVENASKAAKGKFFPCMQSIL